MSPSSLPKPALSLSSSLSLTSSCVALRPSAAAEEACVDEAFFEPWRRSGRAETAVVEEAKRLTVLSFFFPLEEEVERKEKKKPPSFRCRSRIFLFAIPPPSPPSLRINEPGPGEQHARPARLEEGRCILLSFFLLVVEKEERKRGEREMSTSGQPPSSSMVGCFFYFALERPPCPGTRLLCASAGKRDACSNQAALRFEPRPRTHLERRGGLSPLHRRRCGGGHERRRRRRRRRRGEAARGHGFLGVPSGLLRVVGGGAVVALEASPVHSRRGRERRRERKRV